MKKIVITVILIVVLVVLGYSLSRTPVSAPDVPKDQYFDQTPTTLPVNGPSENQPSVNTPPVTPPQGAMTENTVVYSGTGFSPNTVTVKAGDTVTFKNESSHSMWPASAIHPTHTAYSGTSLDAHCPDTTGVAFDACKGFLPGENWSFKFDKVGTWRYHDHLNPQSFGSVVVK